MAQLQVLVGEMEVLEVEVVMEEIAMSKISQLHLSLQIRLTHKQLARVDLEEHLLLTEQILHALLPVAHLLRIPLLQMVVEVLGEGLILGQMQMLVALEEAEIR